MIIRTPDQRLRVFVSSTLQELAEERVAAREAISRLRLAPVMFELGARPHPPRDLYRAYLEQSHIFIGIYWERYGWVAPDMDISGLEDEWLLSGNRPKLIYVKSPAPNREPRLQEMLDRVRNDGNASYKPFSSAAELQQLIENDLAILLTERFEMTQPAAPTAQTRLSNLPAPTTPLIGREVEVGKISTLLLEEHNRLITLYGPGGIGKTRLAVAVGRHVAGHFADGVCMAQLASVIDHNLVVPTIGQALGLGETRSAGLTERVIDTLRDRQMLLILDNFEQVLPAASQIAELLAAAPRVEMIVTSRTVLNVRGEVEFAVPTLALPRPQLGTDHAEQSSAMQLFELAAKAVKPDFVITEENAGVVAEVCARLDGLPLAIELAAARIKMLSPQAILARLIDAGQQARLLSGGARDLPARQQTLQNTLDWSYGLLEPREQVLFARLSVFVGGWTLESSAAACGFDSDELEVMDTLSSLADKSLITRMEQHKDSERFTMLNTIGEYAATKLDAGGETDETRKHHAQYFVQLAQRTEPELRGARQYQWLTRLEHENDNFQAALNWLIEGGDPVTAAQLGWSLRLYWLITSRLSEGLRWMISALSRLDVSSASPPPQIEARARALAVAGLSSAWQGNGDWSSFLLKEAESLCAHLTAPDIEALVHAGLAIVALYTPDANEASAQFEQSLALFRRIGDSWGAAMVMSGIERLAISRDDYVTTQRLFTESQSLAQTLGDSISQSLATFELGRMDLRRQDADAALKHFRDALRHASHAGYREGIARGLVGLAETAGVCKDAERAATLLGAAHAVRNALGVPMWQVETATHEQLITETRGQMGEKFDPAWSRGARMSLDEAVAYALA